MQAHRHRGFTLTEILIVVVVIAVLAMVGLVSYSGLQRRSADAVVQQTIADGRKSLELYYLYQHNYPPNIADTDYTPPLTVATVLYTNAPQVPVYSGLTSNQNAQLFLNACNGFMPITDGSSTYNTSCVYNGNNEHIAGTQASNVVVHGPAINQADFVLRCGAACDSAQNNIISTFLAQGGTFPVIVPKKGSILPAPTSFDTTGAASKYCLEGRSPQFADVIYHAATGTGVVAGPCPNDPELHYP